MTTDEEKIALVELHLDGKVKLYRNGKCAIDDNEYHGPHSSSMSGKLWDFLNNEYFVVCTNHERFVTGWFEVDARTLKEIRKW